MEKYISGQSAFLRYTVTCAPGEAADFWLKRRDDKSQGTLRDSTVIGNMQSVGKKRKLQASHVSIETR